MDFTTFKVSNGWVQSFKKWYSAVSSMLSGEAADVHYADVEDWKLRLLKLRKGYYLDNIFNQGEKGLFYQTLPTRSLVANIDYCKGGKKAREDNCSPYCQRDWGEIEAIGDREISEPPVLPWCLHWVLNTQPTEKRG